MGKLKEKLLNNLTPEEMDEQTIGDISAFEYVEYIQKYKQLSLFDDNGDTMPEEYIPTDEEIAQMSEMVKEYYESDEYKKEMDEINELMALKYSNSDIISALDSVLPTNEANSKAIRDAIMFELNQSHNLKMGYLD